MGGDFRCSSECLHNACIWLFIRVCLNWRPLPLPVFLMQCLRLRGIVQPGLVPKNQKQNQKVAETLVFMLDVYVWTIVSDNHLSRLTLTTLNYSTERCGKVGRLQSFWFNQETYYRIISQDLEVRQHEDKPTQRAPPPASRFFARVPQWGGVSPASHIASGSNTQPVSLPFPHVRNANVPCPPRLRATPKGRPRKTPLI